MRKLRIWNGRGASGGGHMYLAAHSRADAARMLAGYYGGSVSSWVAELRVYFAEGLWGNSMVGVSRERGIWEQEGFSDTPIRVYPKIGQDSREAKE